MAIIDTCTLEIDQNALLSLLEQQIELGDDRFEDTHSELRGHFRTLARAASRRQSAQLKALLAAGQATERKIFDYWAAQA